MNKTDHTETYRPWQTQGTQNEWLPLSASFSEDGCRKPTPGATWKTASPQSNPGMRVVFDPAGAEATLETKMSRSPVAFNASPRAHPRVQSCRDEGDQAVPQEGHNQAPLLYPGEEGYRPE